MIDTVKPLTARAKLALSRTQLLGAMGFEELKGVANEPSHVVELPKVESNSVISGFRAKVSDSIVGSWWRRSRLSSMVELSEPFLENYASRHPGKLIAYGAGTGALLWILKPWKLLSVATVVGLLLKSSAIKGMLADFLSHSRKSPGDNFPPLPGSSRLND